jgi:hypothetical protein
VLRRSWASDDSAERVLKAAMMPSGTSDYPRAQSNVVPPLLAPALADELGQVRAGLTIAKAFNNNKSEPRGGDVVDLPALPLRKRARRARKSEPEFLPRRAFAN